MRWGSSWIGHRTQFGEKLSRVILSDWIVINGVCIKEDLFDVSSFPLFWSIKTNRKLHSRGNPCRFYWPFPASLFLTWPALVVSLPLCLIASKQRKKGLGIVRKLVILNGIHCRLGLIWIVCRLRIYPCFHIRNDIKILSNGKEANVSKWLRVHVAAIRWPFNLLDGITIWMSIPHKPPKP